MVHNVQPLFQKLQLIHNVLIIKVYAFSIRYAMSTDACYFELYTESADILDMILSRLSFVCTVRAVQRVCVRWNRSVARQKLYIGSVASCILEDLDLAVLPTDTASCYRTMTKSYATPTKFRCIDSMMKFESAMRVLWAAGHKLHIPDILSLLNVAEEINCKPDGKLYIRLHCKLMIRIYEIRSAYNEMLVVDASVLRRYGNAFYVYKALRLIWETELSAIVAYRLSESFCVYRCNIGYEYKHSTDEEKKYKLIAFHNGLRWWEPEQPNHCRCTIS